MVTNIRPTSAALIRSKIRYRLNQIMRKAAMPVPIAQGHTCAPKLPSGNSAAIGSAVELIADAA